MPSGIYKRTPEHGAKIGHALKGRKLSEETKRKMKENHKGFTGKRINERQRKILDKTGFKHSEQSKFKMRLSHIGKNTGENHFLWKGENVGYVALHRWIVRYKGNPLKCELCGNEKAKKYEWANKDHRYKRDLNEYFRVCTSCHRKYDIKNNNYQKDLAYA